MMMMMMNATRDEMDVCDDDDAQLKKEEICF